MFSADSELRDAVNAAAPKLLAMAESAAARSPAPGKWSPKQIIGHLIDSASNNHQRFVRAQFTDELVFPGYAQDEWVAAGNYAAAPWSELVEFWRLYNLQIARVMETASPAVRTKPRARHNLDEIASHAIPKDQATTLEYFMADYVWHLKHHLSQIFPTT